MVALAPVREGTQNGLALWATAAPVRPQPFKTSISNTVGCVICQSIASHALLHLEKYMERKGKTQVAAYEVEDFLEHICDPNNIAGAWIRRIGLAVVPDEEDMKEPSSEEGASATPSNSSSPMVHLEVRHLPGYAKCNRVCATVRDYCLFIKEYSTFDDYSREVALLSKKEGRLSAKENAEELYEKICSKYFSCVHKDRIMMSAARDLNSDPGLRAMIENDPVEIISFDQLPNEFTSYKSQKKNAFDALTAEDIETLHAGISAEDENAAARRANREFARLQKQNSSTISLPLEKDSVPKDRTEEDDKNKIVKGSRYGRFSGYDL